MIPVDLKSLLSVKISDEDHPLGNKGKYIIYPKTEEEIAEILKYANDSGKKISLEGGGTKQGFGGLEKNFDLVLSLSKYKGIIEHSIGDMTMTVKSGTTIKEIQDYLATYHQQLALDPFWSEYATIGGVISSNDSGPKRLKYGSARDVVIGLKVVYPDGRVIRTGGKVVKNVAGYDMNKLFIGAMGTLGVISEVTVKLRPIPKYESLILLSFPESKSECIKQFVISLLDSKMEPVTLELINPQLSQKLIGHEQYTIALVFEDVKNSVVYQQEWVQENTPDYVNVSIFKEDETRKFWKAFSKIAPNSVKIHEVHETSTEVALKIGSENLDVFNVIQESHRLSDRYGVKVQAHGGLGHGISQVYLKGEQSQILASIQLLRDFMSKRSGYVVIKHAPLSLRQRVEVWGKKPTYFFLLEGIKKKIDPNYVLNSKRFVGGI